MAAVLTDILMVVSQHGSHSKEFLDLKIIELQVCGKQKRSGCDCTSWKEMVWEGQEKNKAFELFRRNQKV